MAVIQFDEAQRLAGLLAYARRGWHIFPCYEVSQAGHCTCKDGAECESAGKHPRTPNGWKNASSDPEQIRQWHKRWPEANWAIACGLSGLAVVDVDPRNQGDQSLADLESQHGSLPRTVTACTGGGGQHYLYRADLKSGVLALGIEIKAQGGYIVVAPSNHISGRTYSWDAGAHPNDTEIAELPNWIAKQIGSPNTKQYEPSGTPTEGFLGAAFEAAGWLGKSAGQGKHSVQCPWEHEHTSGKRYDSSTVVFGPTAGYRVGWFHCSHSHCAHRKLDEVLAALPEQAKRLARERLKLDPQYNPETEHRKFQESQRPLDDEWAKALKFTQHGGLSKDAGNIALILTNLDDWRGCLVYDDFADRVLWSRPVPEIPGLTKPKPGDDLADHHVLYVRHWFAKYRNVSYAKTDVQDALVSAAKANPTHPAREWLASITWDRVRRVPTWLNRYLGAADDPYTNAVGRWWLISAIARVMSPGCQADHMIVLEAAQGAGKSTAANIMGGDWFLDSMPDVQNKDAPQLLQGRWIVEVGELDAFKGAAITRIKEFISRRADHYRAPYDRFVSRRARQSIFVGTTNESAYLSDATGNRRFWPVKLGQPNRDLLIADRAQLWAEALCMFEAGEQWWPDTDLIPVITEQQEERYQRDEWEIRIEEWLDRQTLRGGGAEVQMSEILLKVFSLEPSKWDRAIQTRIGVCLKKLGFTSKQKWHGTKKVRVYVKSNLPTFPTYPNL